jgi:hypothetical protein
LLSPLIFFHTAITSVMAPRHDLLGDTAVLMVALIKLYRTKASRISDKDDPSLSDEAFRLPIFNLIEYLNYCIIHGKRRATTVLDPATLELKGGNEAVLDPATQRPTSSGKEDWYRIDLVEHVGGVGLSTYSPQTLAEGDKCKNRAGSLDRFDAMISRRVEQCKNGVQLDPQESEEKQANVQD